MANSLMILGTHSHAGKSVIATGFCRLLARRGYDVAPFKAQNMSNNAGVTAAGGEMGRAQIVQAEAAGIEPHTDMNPVLLKPEADYRSQIVLNGKVYGSIDSANWMDMKHHLWGAVRQSYDRLAGRHDVIVLEGAGSPAEINLKEMDMVNLPMARHAEAPCILVGDIDRGGVFAALAGTILLLEAEEREQIKGLLINKFRGDASLLGDGLARLEDFAGGVPCLGVVPFLPYLKIAAEDAVVLDQFGEDGHSVSCEVAIIQLPHIANFDEFDPLIEEPGVRVTFVRAAEELGRPDAIIIPGTKATPSDLRWLERTTLSESIRSARAKGAAVVGICGGYQFLGESLLDPEGVEDSDGSRLSGLGLLPTETVFSSNKETYRARLKLRTGDVVSGYEIHTGTTAIIGEEATALGTVVERNGVVQKLDDGAISTDGRVWGTYLHGLFSDSRFRRKWLCSLGWHHPHRPTGECDGGYESVDGGEESDPVVAEFDRVADALEEAVGWAAIARLVGLN